MRHVLDRPVWTALQTRHSDFALGGSLARRYPSSIVAFAATSSDDPESLAAGNQVRRRLEAALAALPVKYREAVVLIAVEGLEPAAAAAIAGVRPDAFRQRLARGRALLEAALNDERRGGDP